MQKKNKKIKTLITQTDGQSWFYKIFALCTEPINKNHCCSNWYDSVSYIDFVWNKEQSINT